jgi:hypothetical protein
MKLAEQIQLPQSEDHPPHCKRDGESDPKSHQQNFDSVATLLHF